MKKEQHFPTTGARTNTYLYAKKKKNLNMDVTASTKWTWVNHAAKYTMQNYEMDIKIKDIIFTKKHLGATLDNLGQDDLFLDTTKAQLMK